MKYTFKDKLFLVTGGSGFLGKPLVARLLADGARVRVLARDEGKLIELKQLYPSVEILTGDVSDEFEVRQAMLGVNGVFHLAASKHIGIAEKQVRECIKSNTIGSMNILEESLKNPVEFVIGISTDKTAKVSGVYGASKFLMERLFKQYEQLNTKCDYRIVRYGNVIYSTGSVLCKWREAILNNQQVTVTDPSATRFFWTVDQAISLIYECLMYAKDSTPFVPEMKGMSLQNLLIAMEEKYSDPSNHTKAPWNIIGLQPGENLHEKIVSDGPDSSQVQQYEIDEIKNLI
jgi:UDP-N-acetylglucosamine 4,6-dehydratase/UDP-glucose 4-epimerase